MVKEKKQSFMQGIMTLMFSQVLIKILGLVYKLYLTNKKGFGDAGNAIYNSGFQIYALLLTIASIGVPNAIAKLISEKMSIGDNRGAQKVFKVSLALFSLVGFAGATILFLASGIIANEWLQIPEAKLSLMVLAPSIFFVSIISVFRGYFNGNENMRPMAQSQTIEQLAKTIFTIVIVEIVCLTMGYQGMTGTMAAGANLATTVATFISCMYLCQLYMKKRKNDRENAKERYYKSERVIQIVKKIIIIAMPLTVSAILGSLNKNIDSFTVVRGLKTFMTEEQAKIQYGMLSGKIDTLVTFPLSFNMAFATALVPAISAAKARGDNKNIEKRISFSTLITILIGLPCTIGMMIFAKPILEMLFPNASGGDFIYRISSMSIVFITIEQTVNGALQGLGKISVPVISLSTGVFIKLVLNLILIKINPEQFIFGGVAGAALATVACHIISMSISFVMLKKSIKMKFNIFKFVVKPLLASILMGIAGLYVYNLLKSIIIQNIAIILSIIFAIVVYVIALFVLRIFNKEEKNMLPFYNEISKKLKLNEN